MKRIGAHQTLAMAERYAQHNGTHSQAGMDKLQVRFKQASCLPPPCHVPAKAFLDPFG